MSAVARKMEKQEKEHAALRYFHEQEVAKQDLKNAGVQDKSSRLFGNDFMDSDTEVDFAENDGDGEYVSEGEDLDSTT
jgi:hypothetical protein